jgi:hypothetical protein
MYMPVGTRVRHTIIADSGEVVRTGMIVPTNEQHAPTVVRIQHDDGLHMGTMGWVAKNDPTLVVI